MLVIEKEKEKDLWLIRSFKEAHLEDRDYRCYIDVCREKKTLTLYNCSKTIERGIKKIFRMSKKDENGVRRIIIYLSDDQMRYVDVVLAGARWSAVLRHYMEEKERS